MKCNLESGSGLHYLPHFVLFVFFVVIFIRFFAPWRLCVTIYFPFKQEIGMSNCHHGSRVIPR
jgi:hypothetical protein